MVPALGTGTLLDAWISRLPRARSKPPPKLIRIITKRVVETRNPKRNQPFAWGEGPSREQSEVRAVRVLIFRSRGLSSKDCGLWSRPARKIQSALELWPLNVGNSSTSHPKKLAAAPSSFCADLEDPCVRCGQCLMLSSPKLLPYPPETRCPNVPEHTLPQSGATASPVGLAAQAPTRPGHNRCATEKGTSSRPSRQRELNICGVRNLSAKRGRGKYVWKT